MALCVARSKRSIIVCWLSYEASEEIRNADRHQSFKLFKANLFGYNCFNNSALLLLFNCLVTNVFTIEPGHVETELLIAVRCFWIQELRSSRYDRVNLS